MRFALVTFAACVAIATSASANTICDPRIYDDGTPYGYRFRTDRCEGYFGQPLSSASFRLLSFHRFRVRLEQGNFSLAQLRWRQPGSTVATVHIRGASELHPYALDARVTTGAAFSWSSQLMNARSVGLMDIDIIVRAWSGDHANAVGILPADMDAQTTASKTMVGDKNLYFVIFRPGSTFEEIEYRVTKDSNQPEITHKFVPLRQGIYNPARVGLRIQRPQEIGWYLLEIRGRYVGGAISHVARFKFWNASD